jgi:hypothetical protein
MNRLVGKVIERPPRLEVKPKPELEGEDHSPSDREALQRLLDDRTELRDQIHDLRLSGDNPDELEATEDDLADVDAMLFPNESDRARVSLQDQLAWINRQHGDHEKDPAKEAERLAATAHAYASHVDRLDPDRDQDVIADGRAFMKIVNPG